MSLWRQECFFALSIKNQCNCKFTFEVSCCENLNDF